MRAIDVEPALNEQELSDTLKFACNAVLGVLVGVNEILGGTRANSKINAAADAYEGLYRMGVKPGQSG